LSDISATSAPVNGSANYIQNSQSQQSTSHFNISGSGVAETFVATGINGFIASREGTFSEYKNTHFAVVSGGGYTSYNRTGLDYRPSGNYSQNLRFTQEALTAHSTINLPNKSGTVALLSDIPTSSAPASGSGQYIQNQYLTPQINTNAWIGGNFKAQNLVATTGIQLTGDGNSISVANSTKVGALEGNGVTFFDAPTGGGNVFTTYSHAQINFSNHQNNGFYQRIYPTNVPLTAHSQIYFPNKSGTIALLSDLAASSAPATGSSNYFQNGYPYPIQSFSTQTSGVIGFTTAGGNGYPQTNLNGGGMSSNSAVYDGVLYGPDNIRWNRASAGGFPQYLMPAPVITAIRNITLPDKSGTVALTSDIVAGAAGTYVPYSGATAALNLGTQNLSAGTVSAGQVYATNGIELNNQSGGSIGVKFSNTQYTAMESNGFGVFKGSGTNYTQYQHGGIRFTNVGDGTGFQQSLYHTNLALTANSDIRLPNKSGIIALLSDITTTGAPATGSTNYIQNSPTLPQTANIKITGNIDNTGSISTTGSIGSYTSGGNVILTGGGVRYDRNGFWQHIRGASTLTTHSDIYFPNKSGTVALLTDIPAAGSSIPYVGATQNIELGNHTLKVGSSTTTNMLLTNDDIYSSRGYSMGFRGGGVELRGNQITFMNTGDGPPVYGWFGNGNNGPKTEFGHLRITNAPTSPTDVVRLQDLAGYATGASQTSITGTANQIIASATTGAVTLSLPQSISTESTPSFAGGNFSGNTFLATTSGDVGIATTNTRGYKLAVNGSIRAKEIKVEAAPWPDYVFTKTHKLVSLGDLEKYIQINQHLPNIPSAAEVEKDGIKLGEMNSKLLEKIEEITLYLIEMKKENEALKTRLDKLEKK
jgi:hypothetical protein